jgi:hypothetical protein
VTLRAATEPAARRDFSRVPADGLELYVSAGLARHLPERLELVLRGFGRKRVTAYWNGLPWVRL